MKQLLFLLIGLGSIVAFSQDYIVAWDAPYKYFSGKEEPPIDWKEAEFTDNHWETGQYSIGYGDGDDSTIVDITPSLFLRYQFDVADKDLISKINFICDFDDGFIAYINGAEFARVNMGKKGSETSYNQLADRSHEAKFYRRLKNVVAGYTTTKEFLKNNLKNGNNILSVEVHNDSLQGSDLTFVCSLLDISEEKYNIFKSHSRYKASVELDSTHLPIILIESNEYGIPWKRIEVPGSIGIIDQGPGKYNKPGDNINKHSGSIEIELRGESSSSFPKRSYDFELKDEQENDTSVSLLGMPREQDWVIQGPWADRSQIRNAFIYDLGRKLGGWTPRVKFCEVLVNGEYVGLYNLIEKIKRDSNRVDLARLRPEEISGMDLTGGYIIKYDKGSDGLQMVYPREGIIQESQRKYINNFFDEYYGILNSNDGLDQDIGYSKYIDSESLIDYIIVSELGKNLDSYLNSTYMHKDKADRDNRIKYGPLWDFDLCMGNGPWQQGSVLEGWQFDVNKRLKIQRLFQDPKLVDEFADRWFELRLNTLHYDSLTQMIDSYTSYLGDALDRNYTVWPVLGNNLFSEVYQVNTYDEEIAWMKNWLEQRLTWIDENIEDIYYPIREYTGLENTYISCIESLQAYPNPFIEELAIKLKLKKSGLLQLDLINSNGQFAEQIASSYVTEGDYQIYWHAKSNSVKTGAYLLRVRLNGETEDVLKLIKLD